MGPTGCLAHRTYLSYCLPAACCSGPAGAAKPADRPISQAARADAPGICGRPPCHKSFFDGLIGSLARSEERRVGKEFRSRAKMVSATRAPNNHATFFGQWVPRAVSRIGPIYLTVFQPRAAPAQPVRRNPPTGRSLKRRVPMRQAYVDGPRATRVFSTV